MKKSWLTWVILHYDLCWIIVYSPPSSITPIKVLTKQEFFVFSTTISQNSHAYSLVFHLSRQHCLRLDSPYWVIFGYLAMKTSILETIASTWGGAGMVIDGWVELFEIDVVLTFLRVLCAIQCRCLWFVVWASKQASSSVGQICPVAVEKHYYDTNIAIKFIWLAWSNGNFAFMHIQI